jgi:hypothetical protein
VEYYADAEGGAYLEDPDRDDLLALIGALDTTGNTFFVVYAADEDDEWFISVSKNPGAFGGYQIRRNDPDTGELATSTAADPHAIATAVLDWVSRR